jgi:glyoxylase-like metal-dependent hydrolase (beta-lactamase superfamily II)
MLRMEIHTIDLEFQGRPSAIAAFLIETAEGFVLIETGPESTRETLLAKLAARGVAPTDLKAIFVTHVHLDHAGAAGWFAREGVPVHVHHRGARHLIQPEKLVQSARSVYGDAFDALWGDMVPAPVAFVHSLNDGSIVSVAGLEVEAIETPGHAFHHHAFQIGDCLFAGDSAGARLMENPFTSVTSAPPQYDLEHTLASLTKLAEVDASRLFLTHFGEVSDKSAHLAAYRDAVELNTEFIRQRLAEGYERDVLQVAYEAFQLEQAFRSGLPPSIWETLQVINGTGMCADGISLYWEKMLRTET